MQYSSSIFIDDILFNLIGVDKIVGWALSYHFMNCSEAPAKDAKLKISTDRSLCSFELLSSVS